MKYKVISIEVPPDDVVELPDNVIPLNTIYNPGYGLLYVSYLDPVSESPEEEPTEEQSDKEGKED